MKIISQDSKVADPDRSFGVLLLVVIARVVILTAILCLVVALGAVAVLGVFALLVAATVYLTNDLRFERRIQREINGLDSEIADLDERICETERRIQELPISDQLTAQPRLIELIVARGRLDGKLRRTALVLSNHIAVRIEALNQSKSKLLHKIDTIDSQEMTIELSKKDSELSVLQNQLELLRYEFEVEPDPPHLHQIRKYPLIRRLEQARYFIKQKYGL